jgi:hypothetical protein
MTYIYGGTLDALVAEMFNESYERPRHGVALSLH